jgi:single-stranded-DNA-specific exonuclease
MQKRWELLVAEERIIANIQQQLDVPNFIAKSLAIRGIKNFEDAKNYFRPNPNHLNDPFEMLGMQSAIDCVEKHLKKKSKIMIYGDYDVDGTTAVAVFLNYFKPLVEELYYHVPDRKNEGYGVSNYAVDLSIEKGINLFITLDCGITANEALAKLHKHNIDTIVCDHHLPSEEIPPGIILNPKIKNCKYPFKELSGCGVGVKLLEALAFKGIGEMEWVQNQYDLLAISIGSDMVPIIAENRYYAAMGLKQMSQTQNKGLQTLLQISGITEIKNMQQISFGIGPRINAAGRMDHASKVVELFTSDDPDTLIAIAEEINQDNIERKALEAETSKEAWTEIVTSSEFETSVCNITYAPHWEKGLVGIVASKIQEKKYVPTIILTQDKEYITGSARSVGNINIHECLKDCAHLLVKYGGHAAAAGLTLQPENLNEFAVKINEAVQSRSNPKDFIPQLKIDAEVSLNEISGKAIRILEQFEPCGIENPKPIYFAKNLVASGIQAMGINHIKFFIRHNDQPSKKWKVVFFGGVELASQLQSKTFHLAFELGLNEWMDKKEIQLFAKDVRFE